MIEWGSGLWLLSSPLACFVIVISLVYLTFAKTTQQLILGIVALPVAASQILLTWMGLIQPFCLGFGKCAQVPLLSSIGGPNLIFGSSLFILLVILSCIFVAKRGNEKLQWRLVEVSVGLAIAIVAFQLILFFMERSIPG